MTDPNLLRLLQLASPALPVGAYAYSQGLEYAVEQGWVDDEDSAGGWLSGLLLHAHAYLDVPVFARLYAAWNDADRDRVGYWNDWLFASREASERRLEEHQLGTALAKLLTELGVEPARDWRARPGVSFATPFSLAAVSWGIALRPALAGWLWAWAESQVAAAIKLVPLGQTAGQRLLSAAQPAIGAAVTTGLNLNDDEIGFSTPALAIACARHETQYTRLFRS